MLELKLLLEKDAIVLLDKQDHLTTKPDEVQKNEYLQFQQQNFDEQHEYLRRQKIDESRKVLNKIIAAKQTQTTNELEPDSVLNEIAASVENVPVANLLVQIPTQHPRAMEEEVYNFCCSK